ncbi:hypothetical protein [Chamaesiphon sp. OTE_75_metabat_556]|jgi:hypothetical protein|uniref:hypothetical protein n=1 Tax=Chamaesiphon sp. OTE_75_metabat_556 TaxID=2964692 RepID=UPI00286D461B|nr:hypothetical protein [Chamaesiphon sp. OTE_75_metabat_556]
MDDPNISYQDLAARGASDSAPQVDCDRLQTITEACSVMKDEMASQAHHIIGGNKLMGKPPTITQACSVIKDRMTSEAQQILSNQQPPVKSQTFTQACDSIKSEMVQTARQIIPKTETAISTPTGGDTSERFASEDADAHFYLHPIEQAQKAMLESQWFEQ